MKLVNTAFPKILFSGSPAEAEFKLVDVLSASGTYPYILLCLTSASPPIDGNTLVLNREDGSQVTFTFNNTDTATPGSVPAYISGSFSDYLKALAAAIYRHPAMNASYNVQFLSYYAGSGLGVIEIISRSRGTINNITIDGATTVAYDATDTFINTSSADDAYPDAIRLNAKINIVTDDYVNSETKIVDGIQIDGTPDSDRNEIKFSLHDIPDIASAFLGVDIPENAFAISPHRKSYAKMQLEITGLNADESIKTALQQFNDIGLMQPVTGILKGGMPLTAFAADNLWDWLAIQQTGLQKFLTWQPRNKLISKESPEWLSCIIANAGTCNVQFKVYYNNGTSATQTTSFNSLIGFPWMIPTGYTQNNLAALNPGGVTELYYTVVVTDGDGVKSETYTYTLDQRFFRDQRYFIFQNSLGAIDTLRCVGVNKYTIKRNGIITGKALSSKSTSATGTIEMLYNEHEQTWTMRTGWLLTKAEMELMSEFFRSTYIAEALLPLHPAGDTHYKEPYRSVIILQDSVDMWEETDGQWGMEWKMKYAHDERFYSSMPTPIAPWFDTEIVLILEITELTGVSPSVSLLFDHTSHELTINGTPEYTVYTLNKVGTYNIKIRLADGSSFGMQCLNLNANLTICEIVTPKLQTISLYYFQNINDDYLCKRIETLYSLRSISIWGATDPGFNINKMLSSLTKLYNQGTGELASIDFSFATPSAAGYVLKSNLVADGLTVNTL